MSFRTERDSMGEVQLPAEALYQAQTQRALDNFQISQLTMPPAFIKAVLRVKQAAAAAACFTRSTALIKAGGMVKVLI